MDKRTVIAVVLAVVVIIASMIIQSTFFPPSELPEQAEQPPKAQAPAPEPSGEQPGQLPGAQATGGLKASLASEQELLEEEEFSLETNVYTIRFSNRGGVINSIKLKEFENTDGSQVEMVLNRSSGRYPFSIHFGDFSAPPVNELFHTERSLTGDKVEFYRSFQSPSGIPFTLRKSYVLKPDDYIIELNVTIENSINDYPDLNFNNIAYTLGFGPQIGPEFEKLDRRSEYREYMIMAEGEKDKVKIPKEGVESLQKRVNWAAIAGKYFEVIAVPGATDYRITYDNREIPGLHEQSSFYFSRPLIKSSKNTDTFHFYLGPKKRDVLLRYNDPQKNAFNMADMHFEETAAGSPIIGWLANILKFFLELFYRLVPNYGVAIILLTILIKALLFPLTHKSYESTSRMQTLQPKINALREKYKTNPQKMNQEMAALYKKEGVNPMGGCLPLLFQLPIFIALYNLLSNHFELRGASFIDPWIVDLSSPESVWDFSPFAIPFVGWHELRILPFVMLVTTFLQSRLTQAPGSSGNKQMQMMSYMMPLIFFFILYDMPSGLVLYWTMQNFISIFQQLYINRRSQLKPAGGSSSGARKGRK